MIIMRRKSVVWLALNGAEKATVVMLDQEVSQLIEAVSAAAGGAQ